MISLLIVIDFPDIELSRRAEDRIARESGLEAVGWFAKERLAKRFDGSAAASLRFEQRHPAYVAGNVFFRGKLRKYRRGKGAEHRFTGGTERRAKQGSLYATKRRFGILITGLNPGYGRVRSSRVSLRGELQRMTEGEKRELGLRYAEAMKRRLVAAWRRDRERREIL